MNVLKINESLNDFLKLYKKMLKDEIKEAVVLGRSSHTENKSSEVSLHIYTKNGFSINYLNEGHGNCFEVSITNGDKKYVFSYNKINYAPEQAVLVLDNIPLYGKLSEDDVVHLNKLLVQVKIKGEKIADNHFLLTDKKTLENMVENFIL